MESLCLFFTGLNQVELRTEQVRELEPDEVLVQTSKTLISAGTERIWLSRLFEPGTRWDAEVSYPFKSGYSLVGRIQAKGNQVKDLQEGDRVAVRARHQQFVVTSAAKVFPIPDGVSDEDATWFALASIVQNGIRLATHQLGDLVVVIGLGQLGQLTVQYLRLLGTRETIVIDPIQQRLEMALAHGATSALSMDVSNAYEHVLRLTDKMGANVVYDVTGNAVVFSSALKLLRRFGKLVLLGDTGTPSAQRLTHDVIRKGLQIIGTHDSNPPLVSTEHAYWSHQQMISLFFTYLQRHAMYVSALISHRYNPCDASQAYHLLREDRPSIMGILFDWSMLS